MSNDEKISVNIAAKELNINRVTLIKRLDYADFKITDGQFPIDIFKTILKQKEETVNLTTVINDYYKSIKEKNISSHLRNKFMVYASGFNFWGACYIEHPIFQIETYRERAIYIYKDDVKIIQSHLREMIFLSGASYEEKFEFLINETCLKEYSETARLLRAFFENSDKRDTSEIIETGNYFRYILKKELTEYDDEEITVMFTNSGVDLSGPGRNALVSFYAYMRKHSSCHSNIPAHYNRHGAESKKIVPPYDINTYFSIAYMTLNEEYWDKQCMIQKAVKKEVNAKVWLYHLMQFMCAWRSIDIRSKLPRFKLQDPPREVLNKVANKSYAEQYYISVAEEIGYLFHYNEKKKKKKPKKEDHHDATPFLRLSIPESMKPVFGMLALLCEAHNQISGSDCSLCSISPVEYINGVRLFGTPYSDVFKGKAFSNQRANKNNMNKLCEKSEQEGMDGYLLAAYARSHTGGLGRVPEVTSRYLKAKMDGYSADQIVRCLMERGVCSFVPYMLCSVIDTEFSKKHIEQQTTDIKELCSSPAEIENILSIDEKLAQISKEKVKEIMQLANGENPVKAARQIVENIIRGECYGKNEGVYCLAKACYKGCVQKQRTSCIGCGYEMYLKSVLIELSQEIFEQEKNLNRAATDGERIKREKILKERLYPVSYEILATIKNVFHEDITEYKKILRRNDQYDIVGKG